MLNKTEKLNIEREYAKNKSTLEISKFLNRDHRTIKNYVKILSGDIIPKKMGRPKIISNRNLRRIKLSLSKNPHSTSNLVFNEAGIQDISRATRNRVLKSIGNLRTPRKIPILSKVNKNKRVLWAERNIKTNFQNVLWTDETRVSLDGPDWWSKGWLSMGIESRTRMRRIQGGGGVMIWAGLTITNLKHFLGIIGSELVGPFTRKRKSNLPNILSNRIKLEFVNQIKYLGAIMDKTPNWKSDANEIVNKQGKELMY